MKEKILNFINNEDFHSENENGDSCIDVKTLNTFFNTLFSPDLSKRDELGSNFLIKKIYFTVTKELSFDGDEFDEYTIGIKEICIYEIVDNVPELIGVLECRNQDNSINEISNYLTENYPQYNINDLNIIEL